MGCPSRDRLCQGVVWLSPLLLHVGSGVCLDKIQNGLGDSVPHKSFDYHVAQAFDGFKRSITSKIVLVLYVHVLTSRSPRLTSITTTPNVFRNNLGNAAIYPKRIGSSAAANHINQVDYSASNPKQNNRRARNSPKTRAISCTERTAYYGIVLCRRPYTAKTHIICTSTLTPTNNTEHRTKEHRSKTWRRARS